MIEFSKEVSLTQIGFLTNKVPSKKIQSIFGYEDKIPLPWISFNKRKFIIDEMLILRVFIFSTGI